MTNYNAVHGFGIPGVQRFKTRQRLAIKTRRGCGTTRRGGCWVSKGHPLVRGLYTGGNPPCIHP